jgi:hypothetical protein
MLGPQIRGRSSVWLERRPVTPEVASSSLVAPAIANKSLLPSGGRLSYFMAYTVYILQSDLNCRFYVGSTADHEDRLKRHNQGRSKYTKSGLRRDAHKILNMAPSRAGQSRAPGTARRTFRPAGGALPAWRRSSNGCLEFKPVTGAPDPPLPLPAALSNAASARDTAVADRICQNSQRLLKFLLN